MTHTSCYYPYTMPYVGDPLLRHSVCLPPNFRVKRESLFLRSNGVQSLPNGLQIAGGLPCQLIIPQPQTNQVSTREKLVRYSASPLACRYTHVCSGLSRKASRAWSKPMLLIYWISPFWKFKPKECFSAVKCNASRASACASVIGGM